MANRRHLASARRKLATFLDPRIVSQGYGSAPGATLTRDESRALERRIRELEAAPSFEIQGNRGGTFLRIEGKDETVNLTLGHDCVYVFNDRPMSVFALGAVLAQAWYGPGFERMVADHYAAEVPPWAAPIPAKGK